MYSLNHYRLHIETMIEMAEGCPISYIASADRVDFTIGDPDENFELTTTPAALDNLIATATEAREVVRLAKEAKE